MEKKTIGKLIAVLRKANGMTQKELGDRLFVSDKTISRWERDECTPELSLIPVIAEIFGITTDELLRGERLSARSESDEEEKGRTNAMKSERQFRFMLRNRMKKYRMLTLVSIGIAILGLIAAAVANLSFSEGLIGFCLAAVCIVAAAICQIIFALNAYLYVDQEESHEREIKEANSAITKTAVSVCFFLLGTFAFCLPIVLLTYGGVNYGLMLEFWLPYGAFCTMVVLFVCDLLYKLWIKKLLVRRGLLLVSEKEEAQNAACMRILKRTMALCLSSVAVIGAVAFVFNMIGAEPYIEKQTFDDPQEFKTYMEAEYDEWFKQGYYYFYYEDVDGDVVLLPPSASMEGEYDRNKEYGTLYDAQGEIICTYYYQPNLFRKITFSGDEGVLPVTVITREASGNGYDTFNNVLSILCILAVLDVLGFTSYYLIKRYEIYKE